MPRGDSGACAVPPSPSRQNNNPRRQTRQGKRSTSVLPRRPGDGARAGSDARHVSITTLGNGYLGSRIDEERSEMRYLV